LEVQLEGLEGLGKSSARRPLEEAALDVPAFAGTIPTATEKIVALYWLLSTSTKVTWRVLTDLRSNNASHEIELRRAVIHKDLSSIRFS